MKHFTIISFVALLALGVSCTSEPNASQFVDVNGDQVLVCDMNKVTDTIDFPLSNLLESCEMVRLETTDGAFFDRARFVDISENYILIKSAGRFPVKLFDRSGKFIREILNSTTPNATHYLHTIKPKTA